MTFKDQFRLSAHAVITNEEGHILLLKTTYGDLSWTLPGGALDANETVHEALERECIEELGVNIKIIYMSGMYFHKNHNSQACIFRCELPINSIIKLSEEHSAFHYFNLHEMTAMQQHRVIDCLEFNGKVKSAKF